MRKKEDTFYERYRQSESELSEQLEEKSRAAEWEEFRQSMRECGRLDKIDSCMRKIRGLEIRIKRKAGRSLCDARLDADALIARVQKALASNQPALGPHSTEKHTVCANGPDTRRP